MNGSRSDIRDGDMVLCRNTAPLVDMCLDFILQEKKAYVKGGEIGKNLVSLIKRQKVSNLDNLEDKLGRELKKIVKRLVGRGLEELDVKSTNVYQNMLEKISVIRALSRRVGSISELIEKIERIFSDDKQGICFSTIHKAKGLEADRVHIIEPNLMPSKFARKEWQLEQESNLRYVAITRAKSLLNYIY